MGTCKGSLFMAEEFALQQLLRQTHAINRDKGLIHFGISGGGIPRIYACGPLLDGIPPFWGTQWRGSVGLGSVEEARVTAEQLINRGVSCLKFYSGLPHDLMKAVVEVAASRGIPVAGHVGVVSARDAVQMGVQSLEHASGIRFAV